MLRFSHHAALLVGITLPILETWRRWGEWSKWPTILEDYIAAGLLLYAWRSGGESLPRSRPYLMAAWAYTTGIAYASFFGQLEGAAVVDVSGYPGEVALGIKGFGLALAITSLIGAWRSH